MTSQPLTQQPFSTRTFALGGLLSATNMTPVKILLAGVSGDGRVSSICFRFAKWVYSSTSLINKDYIKWEVMKRADNL
jgi:hypothetical protein